MPYSKTSTSENKYKFFLITIETTSLLLRNYGSLRSPRELEEIIQRIFERMQVNRSLRMIGEPNQRKKKQLKVHYILEVHGRKRESQFNKLLDVHLSRIPYVKFTIKPLLQGELIDWGFQFEQKFYNKTLKHTRELLYNSSNFWYQGQDIDIFKNRNNWFQWQKKIYDVLYNENQMLKEPDPRLILNLVDSKGDSGKSSFFKYLYINDKENIAKITYREPKQLLSLVSELEVKHVYIIEVYHKLENKEKQNLLSIIEDIKSGLLIFETKKELLMDPPHIIVSSKDQLISSGSSKNKWEIFEIKKDKSLNVLFCN